MHSFYQFTLLYPLSLVPNRSAWFNQLHSLSFLSTSNRFQPDATNKTYNCRNPPMASLFSPLPTGKGSQTHRNEHTNFLNSSSLDLKPSFCLLLVFRTPTSQFLPAHAQPTSETFLLSNRHL